ncbi:hypothetical protein [Arthrobacter sp. NPDC090010]|uniref:endo-beta-N-acetylglucosaminidase n=1 Tax=Arthrobacter sp. NPDC090010 TaxID=3363942 RepID=UPI003816C050
MSNSSATSRRTFLTVGGAGLAGLLGLPAAPPASAAPASAAAGMAPSAAPAHPVPGSGGIPAGPSTFGWNPQDLLDFDPATTPWGRQLRCLIPRAPRIAPFAPTQAHPDLDPAVQLSTLTIDDAGSIYEARNQAIGQEPYVYTQRYWPYIDIWGTWHGQVLASVPDDVVKNPAAPHRDYGVIDIPNPGWTEAAHKNGARAIGGWFWPRSTTAFDAFLVQRADGSFPVGDKIVELKKYFGFDGLFINQEASITKAQVTRLFALFRYIKSLDGDFYLQYYDAVLPDSGVLDYQNELNARNLPSLGSPEDRAVDSIFINYDWPRVDPGLVNSAAAVREAGFDPRQVGFAGVEHQKGGFRPMECFGDLAAPGKPGPMSVALFVDTEFWLDAARRGEVHDPQGRAQYRDLERKFWSGPKGNPAESGRLDARKPPYRSDVLNYRQWDGIAHSVVERSPYGALPIVHSFNVGVGSSFSIEGRTVSTRGWNNQGVADAALSWQYWTEGELTVSLDETASYDSGHSLAVSGAGVLHLFKTELRQSRAIQVDVIGSPGLALELGVTRRSSPGRIQWRTLKQEAGTAPGWTAYRGAIPADRDVVARLSLRIRGAGRLGRLSFREAGSVPAPAAVTGFSARRPGTASDVEFTWTASSGAFAYDVFQGGLWLGRTHRDAFFSEGVDPNAGRTFTVVPISSAGVRGAAAVAVLA